MENEDKKAVDEKPQDNKKEFEEKAEAEYAQMSDKPIYHKDHPGFFRRQFNKVRDYLLDHEPLKNTADWTWLIIVTAVSAFSFSYGYRAFISPGRTLADGSTVASLISGGASGISQIFLRIAQLLGYTTDPEKEYIFTSVSYFVINVPLFFLAWHAIGHKFAFVTLINVGFTSLFVRFIPENWVNIFNIDTDFIARALFAGVLTGLSSGLAYLIGTSAGGMDIVTFAIAEKKSTTVGKYSVFINTMIVLIYTMFNAIKLQNLSQINMSLYTCIYFFTSSKMLDLINIKNKKTELQINTDNPEMPILLLRSFPHGCTVIDAIGGYTGKPRKLIYMVVSASEVKMVVNYARKIDPECFVNVTNSTQVYGRFYTKPIR